jgi:hypothetical protein
MVYITNAEVGAHDVQEFVENKLIQMLAHGDASVGVDYIEPLPNNTGAIVRMTDNSTLVITIATTGPTEQDFLTELEGPST